MVRRQALVSARCHALIHRASASGCRRAVVTRYQAASPSVWIPIPVVVASVPWNNKRSLGRFISAVNKKYESARVCNLKPSVQWPTNCKEGEFHDGAQTTKSHSSPASVPNRRWISRWCTDNQIMWSHNGRKHQCRFKPFIISFPIPPTPLSPAVY